MNRGDLWLAPIGGKRRPVLLLTRSEVIEHRSEVTVAEVTTTIRGRPFEVVVGPEAGLPKPSVVNCDGIHTVARASLTRQVGQLPPKTMDDVCAAIAYALDCA